MASVSRKEHHEEGMAKLMGAVLAEMPPQEAHDASARVLASHETKFADVNRRLTALERARQRDKRASRKKG